MKNNKLDIIKNIIAKRIDSSKSTFERETNQLIIPNVTFDADKMKGSLNNESWAFDVGYAFRDALDIQYQKRKRDKKDVYMWTQGPIVHFKEGDTLNKRSGEISLQVKNAAPMGWDSASNEMYYGFVTYRSFDRSKNAYAGEKTVTQLEFLDILINGHDYAVQDHSPT